MRLITLSAGTGWHVSDLRRAAEARGHTLTACHWRELVGRVDGGGETHAVVTAQTRAVMLADADAVLLRTMPPGSLEQIVFRMDLLHALHHRRESTGRGPMVINSPRAIELAVDKFAALERMVRASVPVPRTSVCQRLSDAMDEFTRLGGDAVVKPLFGSEGFGITRVSDLDVAARVFAALERIGSVMYLQQFIDHGGVDHRLLTLDGRVVASMRRRHTADWRTNVARGAVGEPWTPDEATSALAVSAAAACETEVAGVDVAFDREGRAFVLEVNAVPGWRELAKVTGRDVAGLIIDMVENQKAKEQSNSHR